MAAESAKKKKEAKTESLWVSLKKLALVFGIVWSGVFAPTTISSDIPFLTLVPVLLVLARGGPGVATLIPGWTCKLVITGFRFIFMV